jgi:hypothetical protein
MRRVQIIGIAAICALAGAARGDEPVKSAPAPTLDELLGLPAPKKDEANKAGDPSAPQPSAAERGPAGDAGQKALDRKLSDAEAAEQFEQAVALMGDVAERLKGSKDTGLPTQRVQEDILRKLDMVIKQAENNRQQKQRSSSKSQQKQQQQQSQQQQQQQSTQRQSQRSNDSNENAQPPGAQQGALNPELAARGQAWGALPQRVREALVQGNADKYSSLYQRWTEEYYKRLAEEKK